MSDLVERLRAANTWLNEGDCCGQLDASGTCMAPACIFGEALKMAHEAAARIAQLEAALRLRATAEDECRNAVDHVGRYNSGDRINEAKGWVRNAFAKFEEAERAALGEERT